MKDTFVTGGKPLPAYIVTGPTSGIGRRAALELARHGQVILVGRDPQKLAAVQKTIQRRGQVAVTVVCDLSDPGSVRKAATEIAALDLPVAGVLNNAGIFPLKPAKARNGWDLAFTTNHLGPFAFTEALRPHLGDGTTVVFVASAVEDPERQVAVAAGFRGSRYISAAASARGEWNPGGATMPGADAYASSKQAILAAALEFARETPRLNFLALEPGFTPNTGLGRGASFVLRLLTHAILPLFALFMPYWSTPKRAGHVAAQIVLNRQRATGVYFNEKGRPMDPSARVRQPDFGRQVVAETRALLSEVKE